MGPVPFRRPGPNGVKAEDADLRVLKDRLRVQGDEAPVAGEGHREPLHEVVGRDVVVTGDGDPWGAQARQEVPRSLVFRPPGRHREIPRGDDQVGGVVVQFGDQPFDHGGVGPAEMEVGDMTDAPHGRSSGTMTARARGRIR